MPKHIYIDADKFIFVTAQILQPTFYYHGERHFKSQADVKKAGIAVSDCDRIEFLHPPTDIPVIAKSVIKGAIKRIVNTYRVYYRTEETPTLWWCFDGGESNFRKYLCHDYKAKRSPKPFHFGAVKRYITNNLENVIFSPMAEVDDLVAVFADIHKGSIISSNDKDLKNIPTTILNFDKESIEEITEEQALRNFLIQVLMGDSTDGIQGVEKLGLQKSTKIVSLCSLKGNLVDNWNEFLSITKQELEETHPEDELLYSIYKCVPLVDVGGYWSRRLLKEGVKSITKIDFKPILQCFHEKVKPHLQ